MSKLGQRVASLLGMGTAQNIAAWAVAGGAAYYLWVRPQQQAEEAAKARQQLQDQADRAKGKPPSL